MRIACHPPPGFQPCGQRRRKFLPHPRIIQRQIVSVRYHGLIREEKDGAAAPFDEVWHLVKPVDGSHEWAIAGIQQMAAA